MPTTLRDQDLIAHLPKQVHAGVPRPLWDDILHYRFGLQALLVQLLFKRYNAAKALLSGEVVPASGLIQGVKVVGQFAAKAPVPGAALASETVQVAAEMLDKLFKGRHLQYARAYMQLCDDEIALRSGVAMFATAMAKRYVHAERRLDPKTLLQVAQEIIARLETYLSVMGNGFLFQILHVAVLNSEGVVPDYDSLPASIKSLSVYYFLRFAMSHQYCLPTSAFTAVLSQISRFFSETDTKVDQVLGQGIVIHDDGQRWQLYAPCAAGKVNDYSRADKNQAAELSCHDNLLVGMAYVDSAFDVPAGYGRLLDHQIRNLSMALLLQEVMRLLKVYVANFKHPKKTQKRLEESLIDVALLNQLCKRHHGRSLDWLVTQVAQAFLKCGAINMQLCCPGHESDPGLQDSKANLRVLFAESIEAVVKMPAPVEPTLRATFQAEQQQRLEAENQRLRAEAETIQHSLMAQKHEVTALRENYKRDLQTRLSGERERFDAMLERERLRMQETLQAMRREYASTARPKPIEERMPTQPVPARHNVADEPVYATRVASRARAAESVEQTGSDDFDAGSFSEMSLCSGSLSVTSGTFSQAGSEKVEDVMMFSRSSPVTAATQTSPVYTDGPRVLRTPRVVSPVREGVFAERLRVDVPVAREYRQNPDWASVSEQDEQAYDPEEANRLEQIVRTNRQKSQAQTKPKSAALRRKKSVAGSGPSVWTLSKKPAFAEDTFASASKIRGR